MALASTLRRHTFTPGARRDGPRKAPAVAVEHGQRPQVHRVLGHVPFEDVGDGVHRRAAVVIDHALGVAGGAAGVVQRDGIPFVGGQLPFEGRRRRRPGSPRSRCCRCARRRPCTARPRRRSPAAGRCSLRSAIAFFMTPANSGSTITALASPWSSMKAMVSGVQAGVQRVEYRARHGNAEMRLHHRRRVGQHHGHRVALADAAVAPARWPAGGSARRPRPRCGAGRRG